MPTVNDLGTPKTVPIESIAPYEENPRRIPPKAIDMVAKSIEEFGWQYPIIVDVHGVIIAGHTRRLAALQLGLTHVPVIVADKLTPKQVKAYRIADNRTSDFTSWDFPELTLQLEELADEFSDVLALADWKAIVSEFNDMEENVGELDIADETANHITSEFTITVVCDSEDTARVVAAAVIDMEGVTDVRDKR